MRSYSLASSNRPRQITNPLITKKNWTPKLPVRRVRAQRDEWLIEVNGANGRPFVRLALGTSFRLTHSAFSCSNLLSIVAFGIHESLLGHLDRWSILASIALRRLLHDHLHIVLIGCEDGPWVDRIVCFPARQ